MAREWGVQLRYKGASGRWRTVPRTTVDSILAAMGASDRTASPATGTPITTFRLDRPLPDIGPGDLLLEDGAEVRVHGRLPRGLPAGYHLFEPHDSEPFALVASPGICPQPGGLEWGFAAQLYACRSRSSWGIGDLADLRRLAAWSASLGAGFMVVSPLHCPSKPTEASPYFPGSRLFLNPLHIALDGAPEGGPTTLNADRLIDRDRVWRLKSAALEERFAAFTGDTAFDSYVRDRGELLRSFAMWWALAEDHGPDWRSWPEEYRRPRSTAVRDRFEGRAGAERIRFLSWVQWMAATQLAKAASALALVGDLAVGVDPGGPDAWLWQDLVAPGMSIGAPPDGFNRSGQDWGLAVFDPWRVREARYQPFVESLRANLRHAGGLRIDHAMGLFRLFWVPDGVEPADGGYVRYPHKELLDILALEAQRAGCYIVGEDLGTVERSAQRELSGRGVLSWKVWWFEDEPPERWPRRALASMSTHDLPTVAGVLSGSDGSEWRPRLLAATGSSPAAAAEDVIEGAYRLLARSPCQLVVASLEDALAVEERPNVPGSEASRPNWRLALPVALDELERRPLPRAIAAKLDRQQA